VQARTGQQYEQPGWREGDLPVRAAAQHRYVVPPVGSRRRRPTRGHRPRAVDRDVAAPGRTGVHNSVVARRRRAGPRWWGSRNPQAGIFECSDGLWVHSMHTAAAVARTERVLRIPRDRGPTRPTFPGVHGRDGDATAGGVRSPSSSRRAAARANDIAMAPVLQSHETRRRAGRRHRAQRRGR
jgi:hypothetical protein